MGRRAGEAKDFSSLAALNIGTYALLPPDSNTQSIFTGRVVYLVCVRRPRQGGCVWAAATRAGCPPDDRSFPSF